MAFEDWLARNEIARSRIETQITVPCVLNVSSAKVADGAAELATLLAYGFRKSGHATLLLSGKGGARLSPEAEMASIRVGAPGLPDLLEIDMSTARSASEVHDLCMKLRTRYSITVSAQCVAENGGRAMNFATQADGVVLGIRNGRQAGESDHALGEALASCGTPVLGVILVNSGMIKDVQHVAWTPAGVFAVPDADLNTRRKAFSAKVVG